MPTDLEFEFAKLSLEIEQEKHRANSKVLYGLFAAIFIFPFKLLIIWWVLSDVKPVLTAIATWLNKY